MLNKIILSFKHNAVLGVFISLLTIVSGCAAYNSIYESFTSMLASLFSTDDVNKQNKEAIQYQKLCEQDDLNACAILGFMYYKGYGVERNLTKAFELSKNGCDNNIGGSCIILGDMYLNGENVSRDLTAAKNLFKKACDQNEGYGCSMLGAMYYQGLGDLTQDLTKAKNLFQHGCNLNDGTGCVVLADMYFTGKGVERDLYTLISLRSC